MQQVMNFVLMLMLVNLSISVSKINITEDMGNITLMNDEMGKLNDTSDNYDDTEYATQKEIIENDFENGIFDVNGNNGTIRNESLYNQNDTSFGNGNDSLIMEGIITDSENMIQDEFEDVIKVNESVVLNTSSIIEDNINNEILSPTSNHSLLLDDNGVDSENETQLYIDNIDSVIPMTNNDSFRKENEIIGNNTNYNITDTNNTVLPVDFVYNNSNNIITYSENINTTNLISDNLSTITPLNQTNNTQQEFPSLNQSSTVIGDNNYTENETIILNNTNPQSIISIPEINLTNNTNNTITISNETLNNSIINTNLNSSSSNTTTIPITTSESSRLPSEEGIIPPVSVTETIIPITDTVPQPGSTSPENMNLNISVNTPDIAIPQTELPNITITEPQIPEIEIPTVSVTPVESSSITIPEITVPEVNINIPTIPTTTTSQPINQIAGAETGSNSISISQAEANNYKVLTETLSDYELLLSSTTQSFIPVISSSSLTDQVLSPDHLNALAQLHSELSINMYTLPQHHLQDILDLQASITPIIPTILGTQCIPMYWQDTQILANDISIGPQGDVYVATVDGHLYQYDIIQNKYTKIKGDFDLGSISKVSVSNDGTPYVITASGSTYYLNAANKWIRLPGCASDIAVGNGGEVYKIGCDIRANGYGIFRLFNNENNEDSYKQHRRCRRKKNNNCDDCSYAYDNKSNKQYWFRLSGSGVRIAVAPSGLPYIVNTSGMILSYENENWTPIITAGLARDIEVTNDGEIFYIDYYYNIFRVLNRKGSVYQLCGLAKTLSAGPFSQPFIIGNDHKVYTASRFMFG